MAVLGSAWELIIGYAAKLNATNWIGISAAAIAVLSVFQNNRLASKRDSLKSKREEFNKQITAPVEEALKEFRALSDKLRDLADKPANITTLKIDELITDASKCQRALSRALRKAASSPLCKQRGWASVGQEQYDDLIQQIDALGIGDASDKLSTAIDASNSIEGIIDAAHTIIYREISRFI